MPDADALFATARRPLVLGVGGGGDVVAALALAEPLERLRGAEPVVGGVSWERRVIDPRPGPRPMEEMVDALEELGPGVLLAGPGTRAVAPGADDVAFAESRLAELTGRSTVLVDPNGGPGAVAEGLRGAIERLGVDLLVLVDVGGDAIAHGDEPGLSSPLCDAVVIAAGARLASRGEVPVLGAVFGAGCDGELTLAEVMARVSEIAAGGGLAGAHGLAEPSAAVLERAVAHVPTEASALPLRCFRGETGRVPIRGGARNVELSPLCAISFFFDVEIAVATAARLARAVGDAESLEAANDVLHGLGVRSELDLERDAWAALRAEA